MREWESRRGGGGSVGGGEGEGDLGRGIEGVREGREGGGVMVTEGGRGRW